MLNSRRISIPALAACAVAVLVGAGCGSSESNSGSSSSTTSAASKHHRLQVGLVGLAASYLGIERSQVRRDLREGKTLADVANSSSGHSANGLLEYALKVRSHQLELLEHEGAITEAQLKLRLEEMRRHLELRLNRQGLAVTGAAIRATVAYLALKPKQLHAERRAGKSLAEIAAATPGRSAQGLIGAIVAAEQTALSRSAVPGARQPSKAELEAAARKFVYRTPHHAGASGSSGGSGGPGAGEAGGAAEAEAESTLSGAAAEGGG